ncbi:hypothetical protein NDU88_002069 [Pleurodeles waltl]|uniref:Uncharacterized protein n=1 Tax=Pleurodeles waltl TaxID=8319 RepID=A0AAV7RDF3_PLEWA|nr:hypothetical protein NDU88_002069 [Pleurodeles waltl]
MARLILENLKRCVSNIIKVAAEIHETKGHDELHTNTDTASQICSIIEDKEVSTERMLVIVASGHCPHTLAKPKEEVVSEETSHISMEERKSDKEIRKKGTSQKDMTQKAQDSHSSKNPPRLRERKKKRERKGRKKSSALTAENIMRKLYPIINKADHKYLILKTEECAATRTSQKATHTNHTRQSHVHQNAETTPTNQLSQWESIVEGVPSLATKESQTEWAIPGGP